VTRIDDITCDIFCRVIDNFGDVGVTWRLAKQLVDEYDWQVRLFVDDIAVLDKLLAENERLKHKQGRAFPAIFAWDAFFFAPDMSNDSQAVRPEISKDTHADALRYLRANEHFHDVAKTNAAQFRHIVIEAFACELPESYVAQMVKHKEAGRALVWLNLEYLSAEAWIDAHHLLASPQQNGLTKHFYFPGFSESSGGLIRERRITAIDRASSDRTTWQQIFIFAYDTESARNAVTVLSQDESIATTMPETPLLAGCSEHASIQRTAFVPQRDLDALLTRFDFLVVRGEDSFLRAQFAAKPFIWHIYPQDEDAHFVKLNAFLDRYVVGLDAPIAKALRDVWMAWNGKLGADFQASWETLLPQLPALQKHALAWQHHLLKLPDLASKLVTFCEKAIKI
jgi:uncharacterized repeat protein (TIGR03837 family)